MPEAGQNIRKRGCLHTLQMYIRIHRRKRRDEVTINLSSAPSVGEHFLLRGGKNCEIDEMAVENSNAHQPAQEGDREPTAPPQVDERPSLRTVIYFGNYGTLPAPGPITEEQLRTVTRQYAIKGALFTVVGIIAIVFPYFFGLAIEQLLGWCLVLGGGVTLVQFLMLCGSPGTTSFLLLGALHFCVGLWLLLKPIEGLTALTFILSGWFLAHGFLKLIMAWQVRHMSSWPAVVVSGLLSLFLGFLIVWLTPTYGLKLVGLVFGADLTATGVSVLIISIIARFHSDSITRSQADVESGSTREPLLNPENTTRVPVEAPST
ncbi:hypothetical protein R1flu_018554 [Riccia fluitans]|uniref:Uncharacterized protein n=1 Tax=Riccia fluitans TaxID=41844 RepID=A0ABD1ZHN6_9MARC